MVVEALALLSCGVLSSIANAGFSILCTEGGKVCQTLILSLMSRVAHAQQPQQDFFGGHTHLVFDLRCRKALCSGGTAQTSTPTSLFL